MESCPCGSGREYESCCSPYISGVSSAPSAEALMRSRYTAYAKHKIDYIVQTCVRDEDHGIDIEATKRWSEKSEWLALRIIRTEGGGSADDKGIVEFSARYILDGLREEHHEISKFVKREGAWLYEEGEVITETVVRASPKVGRNDPCPCGSGKKYKKCCGAMA